MLLIDAILVIFLGFCLVLMTYMVTLLKRLIDDYDPVSQQTLAANKRNKKLPRPPPPPPLLRPKNFPTSSYFVDHTHLVDPEIREEED